MMPEIASPGDLDQIEKCSFLIAAAKFFDRGVNCSCHFD